MLKRSIEAMQPAGPAPMPADLVVSIPPALREHIQDGAPPITRTYDAFARAFSTSRQLLRVMVPYVDPSFTALAALTTAPIRVLTTAGEGQGNRASPVLERCAALRDVTVRYLTERHDRALLYQVHSKLIIADNRAAYVGSANLTDTSIHYNLELGLWTEDRETVSRLARFFDLMYERLGVRASAL